MCVANCPFNDELTLEGTFLVKKMLVFEGNFPSKETLKPRKNVLV